MIKIRWNQMFSSRTLKRGYELYQSGAVEDIQHNDYAIKGSTFDDEDYYSIVYLRDGLIEDMDCSCENEDEYCEHIAALLYAYDPKQTYQYYDFQEVYTDEKYKSGIRDIITESRNYKEMINKLISYKRSILSTISEDCLASLNLVFETFYLISSIPEEKDDVLEELKNDLKTIEDLKIKLKNVKAVSKQVYKVEAPVIAPVTHETERIDTLYVPYQKVEMHNEYIAFDGVIRNDTLKATVNVPITITQVLHKVPKHKFLWWTWGCKGVKQAIVSDNPYVTIKYADYIELR